MYEASEMTDGLETVRMYGLCMIFSNISFLGFKNLSADFFNLGDNEDIHTYQLTIQIYATFHCDWYGSFSSRGVCCASFQMRPIFPVFLRPLTSYSQR